MTKKNTQSELPKMINSVREYHRSELAKQQLRTAVSLFLNEKDLSSVVTLAAAASNILSQLVRNSGKEPFIDYACRVHDAFKGTTPKRVNYKNYIDNIFSVNVHKHMSPSCPSTCTLDLHNCAVNMLKIAMSDYMTLFGEEDDFVKAYLHWVWVREDPIKIIDTYNNMPEKLKKTEKKPTKIELENTRKKIFIKSIKAKKISYYRFQLAANQLETAIMLFLTDADRLSAITLAGAADVIFCELVNREGKKNYTDLLVEKDPSERGREKVGKEINNLLHINSLKHFDKGDEEIITLDVDECAVAAILKALVNYNMLDGKNDKLIIAFRYWVRINLDPDKYNLNDSEQE